MSCSPFDLRDYFFDELPVEARRQMDVHIKACASCRDEMAQYRATELALRMLPEAKPHVLIMDIGMPTQDGYSVMKKVRLLSRDEGGGVPAIALTAFARTDDRRQAILSGFQMHLAKPVEAAELIAMVASLAGRTQANVEAR